MNSGMGRLIGYVRNSRIRRKIQNYDVLTQLRISHLQSCLNVKQS